MLSIALHSQVTLPCTLKYSYHWEILQIKFKGNKVNPPWWRRHRQSLKQCILPSLSHG
jgi:hypothetical protein